MIADFSKWQYDIDWDKAAPELDHVILRIGYRGYGAKGTIVEDEKFRQYYEGVKKHGIPYGVYFFSQAKNYDEGVAEAEWTLGIIKSLDYLPTLPLFIDSENSSGYPNGRADSISREDRTSRIIGFCETILKAGYRTGVYASTTWFQGNGAKVNDAELAKYPHWIADYRTSNGEHYCGYEGDKILWQYTSSGTVRGVPTRVDLNIGFDGFVVPTGDEEYAEPVSEAPIRLVIGYASSGDVGVITNLIDALGGITYEVNDGFIYTSMVSKGDQRQIVTKCEELGIPCKEYVELLVNSEATKDYAEDIETPVDPAGEDFTDKEKNIIIRIIRFLIKLIGGLE